MKIHILFLVMTFLLLACTKKEVKKDDRPDWVDQPDPDFVGICTSHVSDLIAQEKCTYRNGLAASTVKMGTKDIRVSGSDIDKRYGGTADIMYVSIRQNCNLDFCVIAPSFVSPSSCCG